MSIKLRPAMPADIHAMYHLDLLCFAPPFRFDLRTMRRLTTQPHTIALLAEQASTLAGFVILNRNYVSTLDVHPNHRRQGLAHQLMEAAESAARQANTSRLRLHVSAENEPAIRFYESIGFTRHLQVEDFYAPGLHAWLYIKNLAPLH